MFFSTLLTFPFSDTEHALRAGGESKKDKKGTFVSSLKLLTERDESIPLRVNVCGNKCSRIIINFFRNGH